MVFQALLKKGTSCRSASARRSRVLAREPLGIVFNEHTDEDGATVFRHACKPALGLPSPKPTTKTER
jgi:hypothetical protein